MKKIAAIAGLAAVAASGVASADFTSVTAIATETTTQGEATVTYLLFANFDNPVDRLLAISGNDTVSPLMFTADRPLVQDTTIFIGTGLHDTPAVAAIAGANDSWVTIGGDYANGFSDTSFSPGFLGGGPGDLISGSSFVQETNGGYFDENPGTTENGGTVAIAQFTLAADVSVAEYMGTVDYVNAAGEQISEAFSINLIPAPGALALLGLAGLAGTRRRRG
ncbi:MAG: hypothetical protein AB8G96_07915 [Phycisphaerales bacterium]